MSNRIRVLVSLIVVLSVLAVAFGVGLATAPAHADSPALVNRLGDWKTAGKVVYIQSLGANQGAEGKIVEIGSDYVCIARVADSGPQYVCYAFAHLTTVVVENP